MTVASVSVFRVPRVVSLLVLFTGLLLIPNSLAAHDLKTATKCVVDHKHPTTDCLSGAGCASDWEKVEKALKFKSADRMYKGTTAWNCHGRTFNARKAWVDYADEFLRCDRPSCPVSPKVGDTIIWLYRKSDGGKELNGKTKHSVTIVGPWRGLDTLVVSKYGVAGQYKHALGNAVKVYGGAWSPTRFNAGTPISTNAVDPFGDREQRVRLVDGEHEQTVEFSTPDEMLAARVSMPWLDSVAESEGVFGAARAEHIRAVGALRPSTVEALQSISSVEVRAQLLVNDLRDAEHYVLLGVYNAPELDLLSGMDAIRLLRELAENDEQTRSVVTDYLVSLAGELDAPDAARATAVLAATSFLNHTERDLFLSSVAAAASEDVTYVSAAIERIREIEAAEKRDRN